MAEFAEVPQEWEDFFIDLDDIGQEDFRGGGEHWGEHGEGEFANEDGRDSHRNVRSAVDYNASLRRKRGRIVR